MSNSEYKSIDWLLEAENPPVRYWALTELLDVPSDSPKVREIRAEITGSKSVEDIFSKMHPDGYLYYINKGSGEGRGDWLKYWDFTTTHWNLSFLSELGLDRDAAVPCGIFYS
jgi:hypothetical protein